MRDEESRGKMGRDREIEEGKKMSAGVWRMKPEAWFHEFTSVAPSKCVCSLIAGCVCMCVSVCQLRGYYVRFGTSAGRSMK